MFKRLRILILLFILATVAISAWQTQRKLTSWRSTLHVAIFPINGDGSATAAKHIANLDEQAYAEIAEYLKEEGERYGLKALQPVRVTLGPEIQARPPERSGSSVLDAIRWSLAMRYWAWRKTPEASIHPDIRIYALYFDPADHPSVPHSVGLEKGSIGVANLFASRQMHGSNLVVMTHELLHTLGATDKYDPATRLPAYPGGYAEPDLSPRYPQHWAEIMAGRIPISEDKAEIPSSLKATLVGPQTAMEIGWVKAASR